MPDRLTPEQRHSNMSRIRGKDTKPEMLVRQYLWSHGYRYRLHCRQLPGKPDIVLAKYKTCIFINGCFWHGHKGCKYYTIPKSNTEFWVNKVTRNTQRDERVLQELETMGWHCITIWECELKKEKRQQILESLLDRLSRSYFKDIGISLYEIREGNYCFMVAENSDNQYNSFRKMKTKHVVAAVIIQNHRLFATQRGYGTYKDWWEFPGGKIESGETPQQALRREIREELATDIEVGELLQTVEYDYPEFHLSMQCFRCTIVGNAPTLLEHEAARWLSQEELLSVQWLPADIEVLETIQKSEW